MEKNDFVKTLEAREKKAAAIRAKVLAAIEKLDLSGKLEELEELRADAWEDFSSVHFEDTREDKHAKTRLASRVDALRADSNHATKSFLAYWKKLV